jgi:hypothetical protein
VDAVDRAADFLAHGAQPDEPFESDEPSPIAAGEQCSDRLVIHRNGKLLQIVPLNGRLLIGRGENSDLRLASRFLSRHHAMISSTGDGRFMIVDLNSSNGVMVNGERVRRHILHTGDTVELAQYRLKLEREADNPIAVASVS